MWVLCHMMSGVGSVSSDVRCGFCVISCQVWVLCHLPPCSPVSGFFILQTTPDHVMPNVIDTLIPGAKTIKKNTNSTQNKSQTHHANQYEVTSFLSTDCELSTDTCSKNVYSLGPWFSFCHGATHVHLHRGSANFFLPFSECANTSANWFA